MTKSKSGGAHIGLFFDKPYPARDVRHILKKVAYQLCDGTPEIFPKQEELQPNETGSFINLPYHRGNTRVVINSEGKELNFDEEACLLEELSELAERFEVKEAIVWAECNRLSSV